MPKYLGDVRCWLDSGKHLLEASISEFDPNRKLALARELLAVHGSAAYHHIWLGAGIRPRLRVHLRPRLLQRKWSNQ